MATSYLSMAQESLADLERVEGSIWRATISYYSFYYSLYATMLLIGVRSDSHSCSILFMHHYLSSLYDERDQQHLRKAFHSQIDLQYYTDRPTDEHAIEDAMQFAPEFLLKTRDIQSKKRGEIRRIQEQLEREFSTSAAVPHS